MPKEQQVDQFEKNVLHFAAVTMTVLALLYAGAMSMYYWDAGATSSNGKDIFDKCTTVLPPIATLVLGYYFGRHQPSGRAETESPLPKHEEAP